MLFNNRNDSLVNKLIALVFVYLKESKRLSANNELAIDVFYAEYNSALNYIKTKSRH